MHFGLIIQFPGHFLTACDYTLQTTITHRTVFSVTMLGTGFQLWCSPAFRFMLFNGGGHLTLTS